MAYTLAGVTLRRPNEVTEKKIEKYAQVQTLDGTVNRDYYNSRVGTKRIWQLSFRNAQASEYNDVKTIYDTYKTNDATVAFISTESNYPISSTLVHMDLIQRQFKIQGDSYLSDYDLILTEQ